MSPPSDEFKALKAKWYKTLKDSGFDDIEQDEDTLKSWHGPYMAKAYDSGRYKSWEEYYQTAGHFLYDHKFESSFEKKIWAQHAAGKTIIQIVDKFSDSGIKTYKREVHETIQKLSKIMTGKLKPSK